MTQTNGAGRLSSWPYFSDNEMMCQCGCRKCEMDEGFMRRLVVLREAWGRPIIVNSGYRCLHHDLWVRKERSQAAGGMHSRGLAGDLGIQYDIWEFVGLAFRYGFQGIGVRAHGPTEKRFIHLDLGTDSMVRPAFWTYA